MRKAIILALMSLVVAVPAFAKVHKDAYSMPCSQLWDAVQDTLKNSGFYTVVLADNSQLSAAFNISGAIHSRTISVHLEPQGTGCEMQTQTSFSGLMQNDAGDFKSRVDQAITKPYGAKPAEAAKPAN